MPAHELGLLIALIAVLCGLGTLLLALTWLDLAGAAAHGLWLWLSPPAARRARFRAAVAAYRGRARNRVRSTK